MPSAISPDLSLVDRALRAFSRRVGLLAAATPSNAASERLRLRESKTGLPMPRWHYLPRDLTEVRRGLEAVSTALGTMRGIPLAALYQAKVEELDLEARLCECVGSRQSGELAARRFGPFQEATARRADALADAWIVLRPPEPLEKWEETFLTDDPHPESLLSRMRAEVGRRRLPFTVAVHPSLSALAATGDRSILIAAGRRIGAEAARRTVLHEIEGHVLPRVRAREAEIGLFALGTARGADEQEGYALLLEERHGFLTAERKRELAGRYIAARTMQRGASFVHVVSRLEDHGMAARDAVVTAERAFRGSDGTFPGLGRERVYLESYLRVRAHLGAASVPTNDDEIVLASGQIALDAIALLTPYVGARLRPGSSHETSA